MSPFTRSLQILGLSTLLPVSFAFAGEPGQAAPRPSIRIPRLDSPPTLEDFASMQPSSDVARSMTRVDGFRQNTPRDGDPVSQRTEAYLGYDDTNVYVVFVCFDSEPDEIRATLSRREDALSDDKVDVFLDTFNDQRRAYVFTVNPVGVQADGTWVEQEGSDYDRSFDTVWDARGTLTEEGYVIWIAVPFKSLRFSPEKSQEWGLILVRWIRRNNEGSFWPYVTSRIEGRLNQGGTLLGISDVSPGRNLQLIPYGFFRSFRALDDRDASNPRYVSDSAELDGGVDFKTIFAGQPRLRRHRQPGLQPGGVGRAPGDGQPAVRGLLSGEAPVLPGERQLLRDADQPLLQPSHRGPAGRGASHGKGGPVRDRGPLRQRSSARGAGARTTTRCSARRAATRSSG